MFLQVELVLVLHFLEGSKSLLGIENIHLQFLGQSCSLNMFHWGMDM